MNYQQLSKYCETFLKLARKNDSLAVLKTNIGNYVHFSNSERFGISYHKNIHPGNPRALYGFPLTPGKYERIEQGKPEAFYDYGYGKFIYIFTVSGNVLDMDSVNLTELGDKVRAFVRKNYPGSYHAGYNPTPLPYSHDGAQLLKWLARIAEEVFKNEHSGINIILRGIGYDAIETKNYGFGDDLASEIAVLNPSAVNLIAKITNPMLSKEQIKEIDILQSDSFINQQREREQQRKEEADKKQIIFDQLTSERKRIDQMRLELREERKKTGLTDKYLKALEDLNLLEKELNTKYDDLI